ncbi:Ser/Thr protein phosphatase, putative [Trichomonas vaginalis G3]|uniref:Serine/threonine-protein phosphatase n=1 Tax=Trichomonas vaginalis (strain ATCC PRA-98 / G3) TaxID=412133 RepID=A2F6X4_TRIV3|nr:phosphoprotein phosphatase protein [Trichomonas vaginalis G3]EAX99335.1 Ser/Thr protein phosphatase, putative [Trichomonas vaginalis G3]KAI5538976.1 phosphoprotein phosphatase protein [Trichomonas vaginalis G3]|eukprot:XP_001312265.1 Ser/Thr protein phosphatase [Trichomonas vaginalis G3]
MSSPLSEADNIIYKVLQCLMKEGSMIYSYLTRKEIVLMLQQVITIFRSEPILLKIPSNIHVVGDIHGNIMDLIRIFQKVGYPPQQKYLFLGDYVDRGNNSIEILLMLFALKIKYPEHIYLIRGNHENEHMSEYYGFRDEIESKYNYTLFYEFHRVFRQLPLACLISNKIFCVHGGLSPLFTSFEDFQALEKPGEIKDPSIFLDFIWSDPKDQPEDFKPSLRKCGQFFGQKALEDFCQKTSVELVLRAHELCQHGYDFPYANSDSCITVFSSSNYCDRQNKAAIVNVSKKLEVTITQFDPLKSEPNQVPIIFPEWLDYLMVSDIKSNKAEDKFNDSEPSSELDEKFTKETGATLEISSAISDANTLCY